MARWLSFVWAVCVLILGSGPGDLGHALVLMGTGALLAFLWLLELLGWLGRRKRKVAEAVTRRGLIAWWLLPGLAAVLVAATVAGVPHRARFLLSETHLTEYAEQIRLGNVDARAVRDVPVGLFVVRYAEFRNGRVYLITGTGMPTSGFAYAPDATPRRHDNPWVHEASLGRHWWSVRSSS